MIYAFEASFKYVQSFHKHYPTTYKTYKLIYYVAILISLQAELQPNFSQNRPNLTRHFNPLTEFQPSFPTLPILCVLLLHMSDVTYSLKPTTNDKFEKIFMVIFI